MDLLCKKCNETKPSTSFFKESNSKRGYRYTCKECDAPRFKKYREENPDKVRQAAINWKRRVRFNFPVELYNERLTEQGNACAICGSTNAGGRGEFHADHDHITMQPRGVLCHNCNIALGNFKDNPEILTAAIEYLKKYSEEI